MRPTIQDFSGGHETLMRDPVADLEVGHGIWMVTVAAVNRLLAHRCAPVTKVWHVWRGDQIRQGRG